MQRTITILLLTTVSLPPQLSKAVRNLPPPSIYWHGVFSTEAGCKIRCLAPAEHRDIGFRLYKDGALLLETVQTIPDTNRSMTFIFKNGTLNSGGQYRCQYWTNVSGTRHYSTRSSPVNVTVNGTVEPPKFVKKLEPSKVVKRGTSARLECKISGSPEISVVWYKNDNVIKASEKYIMSFIDSVPVLEMNTLSIEDSGYYTCEAHNDAGSASSSIKLTVKEFYPKPSIAVRPGNPVLNGESVTILCKGPRRDVTLALYKGQTLIQEQDSKDQLPVAEFHIKFVGPLDRGSYVCFYRATNGPDQWSMPSKSLYLRVTGISYEPPAPQEGFSQVWGSTVNCSAPAASSDGWFYLFREGGKEPLARLKATAAQLGTSRATFDITDLMLRSGERYSCVHQTEDPALEANTGPDLTVFSKQGEGTQEMHLTKVNSIRMGLAVVVLVLALLFVVQALL